MTAPNPQARDGRENNDIRRRYRRHPFRVISSSQLEDGVTSVNSTKRRIRNCGEASLLRIHSTDGPLRRSIPPRNRFIVSYKLIYTFDFSQCLLPDSLSTRSTWRHGASDPAHGSARIRAASHVSYTTAILQGKKRDMSSGGSKRQYNVCGNLCLIEHPNPATYHVRNSSERRSNSPSCIIEGNRSEIPALVPRARDSAMTMSSRRSL